MEGISTGRTFYEEATEEDREWANKVYIENSCLVLSIKYRYEIELSRIDTKEKVLAWLHHLTEKNWASVKMFRRMLTVLEDYFGMKFDVPV